MAEKKKKTEEQSSVVEPEILEESTNIGADQQATREIIPAETIRTEIQLSIDKEMVEKLKQRYEMFKVLQEEVLEKGVDYGFPFTPKEINPTTKPSLYKSGAEKLLMMFNLRADFEILETIENDKLVFYKFKCIIVDRTTDLKVGEGFGLANSKEKPSWDSNPLGYANVILKIAKKRAMVDATLTTLGASNFFTQDLEDMRELLSITDKKMTPQQVKDLVPPTEEQWTLLNDLIKRYAKHLKKSQEEVINNIKKAYKVNDIKLLTKSQASDIISKILKSLKQKTETKKEEKREKKLTPIEEHEQLLDEYIKKTNEEDFFLIKNMKLKEQIEILKEALKNNKLISDIIGKQDEQEAEVIDYEDVEQKLFRDEEI